MASAIIGSKGFIGSRLKWYADNFLEEEWIGITKENYLRWRDSNFLFDKIIWAAGSARKDESYELLYGMNVHNFMQMTKDFRGFNKLIYISSQAVYAEGQGRESEIIRWSDLSRYGKSKAEGEQIVDSSGLIIRPNGFVGPGLKKNVIHSLAKDPPELYYTWDSKFQIIHTDVFAAIVFMLASSYSGEIFNVASKQVITPVDVARIMGVDMKSVVQPADRVPPHVNAVIDTSKLDAILNEANVTLPSTEEAISKWNESFEVRMPDLQSSVGQPSCRG